MALAMTAQESAAILPAAVLQGAGESVPNRLGDSTLRLRLAISAQKLRPGGMARDHRGSRLPVWRPVLLFRCGSVRVRWA